MFSEERWPVLPSVVKGCERKVFRQVHSRIRTTVDAFIPRHDLVQVRPGKRNEMKFSSRVTILFLSLLFFTLSLGLILAVVASPSRGGQVHVAHASETMSLFLRSGPSVPFGILHSPERPRADCVSVGSGRVEVSGS